MKETTGTLFKQMLKLVSELGARRSQSPIESNPIVKEGQFGVTDKVARTEQNINPCRKCASACTTVII